MRGRTKLIRAWEELPFLPFWAWDRLRQRAALARHRRVARLHADARVQKDGWIHNLSHQPERIRIGAGSVIRGELLIFPDAGQIEIGDWSYVGPGSCIWSSQSVRIGNCCLISYQVSIHDTNSHSVDPAKRREQFRAISMTGHPAMTPDVRAEPIIIEDDVWIGFGATVVKGVTIGRGAIVASGSLVARDVAPFTIVAGRPAEPIGKVPYGVDRLEDR